LIHLNKANSKELVFNIFFLFIGTSRETLRFKSLLYEARIYENAPTGVEILTLQAYYPDTNNSPKKIEYKLAPFDDYLYFNVDSSSAKISTRKKVDRNIGEKYNVSHSFVFSVYLLLKEMSFSYT